jgi:hypothetical protein
MLALIMPLFNCSGSASSEAGKNGSRINPLPKALPRLSSAVLFGFFLIPWLGGEQNPQGSLGKRLEEKPIAVQGGKIGDMLRKWYSQGTAAGNWGDYYDNRDGGHSRLNLDPYPQLQQIEYTKEQIEGRRNWGVQTKILPHVVIGNSSTSASAESGGSNIRSYYTDPRGLEFLFSQYVRSNLYVYPEHRDYGPGHNGSGGYGDLFPTNTPYLIASQGSSGSDQPFLRALAYVLAAFRPQVKQRLTQTGFLMPTVQMILRITGKHLSGPEEYLTGKAHPTVFQGRNLDVKKMVEMAHEITLSNLPPAAIIRVLKEDNPVNGMDYFEPERTEKLGDTPAVIARIFRGSSYARRMTVSAERSRDFNNRPLKFHWVVLRGDPARIKIEFRNTSHSIAEITVPYFRRSPVAEDVRIESNRIDIGVFVHNGIYYSPPAFITYYTLDNEARTYGAGLRPVEIAYGAGTSTISVADWTMLFHALNPGAELWPNHFLQRRFQAAEVKALNKAAEKYHKIHSQRLRAEQTQEKAAAALKSAENAVNKLKTEGDKTHQAGEIEADPAGLAQKLEAALRNRDQAAAQVRTAREAVRDAEEAEGNLLKTKIPPRDLPIAGLVQGVLDSALQDPDLWSANIKFLEPLYESADAKAREAFDRILETLILAGAAKKADGYLFRWTPASGERGLSAKLFTRFEREMIVRLNAVLLSRILFPGIVKAEWRENYVDPRIASAKQWRDIYRYSPDGMPMGWLRYEKGRIREFNTEGLLILDKDSRGRCTRARVVKYELETQGQNAGSGASRKKVKMVPTDAVRYYEYDGARDWKGHIKAR